MLSPKSIKVSCPNCGSQKVWRDGLRDTHEGNVQRWICRQCGYRFSEKPLQKNQECSINTQPNLTSICQICVDNNKETKNLTNALETKTGAGEENQISADRQTRKGQIINFMLYMKKQGFRPSTITNRAELIATLLNQNVDLNNPEDVKFAIADKNCCDGYKKNLVLAYDTFLRMQNKKWDAPKYKPDAKLPFIPLESEIDQIVNSAGKRTSTFLATLKETGADPGEALAIEWIDVDQEK